MRRVSHLGLLLLCASCGATAPASVQTCIKHLNPIVGGYSDAVRVGNILYVAGQLPFGTDGNVVSGDVEGQVRQDWKNLEAVVTAAGGSLRDVVSTTTFITAREYGEAVNKVRTELFPKNPPTSSKIIVAGLACPPCQVEINAVAVLPSTVDKRSCD